ncbi:MAG: DUF4162 domain-containing protein [Deltaproteobacteria bacterium]|nr:DUF4162 domain-containing protein [Deltaproteobacteria bacterium]
MEFASPAALEAAELRALAGVEQVRRVADGWALTVERVHVAVPALLAFLEARQAPLQRLSTHSATLEDVFVTLTGRTLRD